MTKFAAYDDVAIYAVADTAEGALAQAHKDAGTAIDAHFEVAEITPEYAAKIEADGFNPRDSFRIEGGVIVEWER